MKQTTDKKSRLSTKIILSFIALITIIIGGLFVYRLFELDPSSDMVAMRAFEEKIKLPKPSSKDELDHSCPVIKFSNNDSCTTLIRYYYSAKDAEKTNIVNVISTTTNSLEKDGWGKEDVGSSGTMTLYTKSNENVCLRISTPDDKYPDLNGYSLTITPYGGSNGRYCQESD